MRLSMVAPASAASSARRGRGTRIYVTCQPPGSRVRDRGARRFGTLRRRYWVRSARLSRAYQIAAFARLNAIESCNSFGHFVGIVQDRGARRATASHGNTNQSLVTVRSIVRQAYSTRSAETVLSSSTAKRTLRHVGTRRGQLRADRGDRAARIVDVLDEQQALAGRGCASASAAISAALNSGIGVEKSIDTIGRPVAWLRNTAGVSPPRPTPTSKLRAPVVARASGPASASIAAQEIVVRERRRASASCGGLQIGVDARRDARRPRRRAGTSRGSCCAPASPGRRGRGCGPRAAARKLSPI